MSYSLSVQELVAGEVRAGIARAGLSGSQAAVRLGWTQPYMSRRLTGRVPFDVTDLGELAELLDVPIEVFFREPVGASRKAPSLTLPLAA